jgi:hypothetical protein
MSGMLTTVDHRGITPRFTRNCHDGRANRRPDAGIVVEPT